MPYRLRPRRSTAACLFSLLLLLCGDVQTNPGPTTPGATARNQQELRIGSLNAWSVVNKTERVLNVIDEQRLDVLAVTETFIKDDHPVAIKNDIAPAGYSICHAHRQLKGKGGSVAIVTRNELQARPLKIAKSFSSMEVCAVQINARSGRLNIVAVYRPPRSPRFFYEFRSLLDEVIALPGGLYVCGDMNCPSTTTGYADHHLEQIIDDFDLVQHVNELTHKRDGLLNLVITPPTNPEVTSTYVEDMGFPDHFVVTTTIRDSKPHPATTTHESRNLKAVDTNTFRLKLLASSAYTAPMSSANLIATQLRVCVTEILDELAPTRRMTKHCGKPSNRWLSTEAVAARKTRRRLEHRYRRTRSEAAKAAFRAASRSANHAIKESRREFYQAKLAETEGDARGRWKVIRQLLHIDERTVSDPNENQKVCDGFCVFFSNKLSKIATKIRDVIASGTLPAPTSLSHAMPSTLANFTNISVEEAVRAIRDVPAKSSPLDFVPTPLLKSCADVFGPPLARLGNASFNEGVFPDMLKKPDADAEDMANYRPITNLDTVGKIIECLAQKQLRRHIEQSPNVGSQQSAYRALHSTETAMTRVANDLFRAADHRTPTILLALDISAAFDTLDHDRLLERAKSLFGFDDIVLRWLRRCGHT